MNGNRASGYIKYSNALIVFIIYDQNQNNLIENTGVVQQFFNKGVQLMNLILCFHHSKLLPIFHFYYANSCCNDMQHSTQIVGNLRTTTTTLSTATRSEIPCTAQAWLTNFVIMVSSTTPNTVQSRRPAVHKLRQV